MLFNLVFVFNIAAQVWVTQRKPIYDFAVSWYS